MITPATRPAFLITIDTEGDNLWASPREITTRNADFLPRFQQLCEKYGFKPTYLTNYEMAASPAFVEMAKDALKRGTAEAGMHLHAWHSPPAHDLTGDDYRHAPYLIEYPEAVMRDKIAFLTDLLEHTFGVKMTSHRAGRWAFNETYARMLVERGYLVDCSVTPHVSWAGQMGDPKGRGGTDYRHFPSHPYYLHPEDISRAGRSPLLELPATVIPRGVPSSRVVPGFVWKRKLAGKVINKLLPNDWIRPKRGNLSSMQRAVRGALAQKLPYLEFMTHSSELMPGGSPYFPTENDVEALYDSLEALFAEIAGHCTGQTLTEFGKAYAASITAKATA